MGKYNFDFEVSAKGWGKSEVIIYEKGMRGTSYAKWTGK